MAAADVRPASATADGVTAAASSAMVAGPMSSAPVFISLDGDGRRIDADECRVPSIGTTRMPSRTLVELIGSQNLQAIQDAFAVAFDIPTVILDHEGHNVNEITHRVAFCEDLSRPSRAGAKCLNCDRGGMRLSALTHRPTIFHCWNDLWDCTVPIISTRGELFGYFLSGQVFFERQEDLERYRRTAVEHGIDGEAYVRAAGSVRVMAREVYARGIECIGVLARMIADQASAALRHRELLDTLLAANAQTEHLAAELDTIARSVSQLSAAGGGPEAMGRLCDSIERVIDCDSLLIVTVEEGGSLCPIVVRDPFAEAIRSWRGRLGEGILGVVAESGQPLHVDDVAAHPSFKPIPGLPIEAEALVAVPLELGDSIVGVLQLSRFERRTFSEHERDLLRVLAAHVAVALGTASLRHETRGYQAVLNSQAEISEALAAGASLDELCDRILGQAESLLACSRAGIRICPERGDDHLATLHMSRRALAGSEQRQRAAIRRAMADGRITVIEDGDEQLLIAPLDGGSGPIGTLLLWRARTFSAPERSVAQSLAHQTATALERGVRLRRERALRVRSQRLAELANAVATADTRERICCSLLHAHELAGGTGTAVVLPGEAPGTLQLWTLDGGRRQVRSLSIAGRPELRFPESRMGGDQAELLDAWGRELVAETAAPLPGDSPATILLARSAESAGAVIVGSPATLGHPERALLSALGSAAAAGLEALERSGDSPGGRADRDTALTALHESALTLLSVHEPERVADCVCEEFRRLVGAEHAVLVRIEGAGRVVLLAPAALPRRERRRLLELARIHARVPVESAAQGPVAVRLGLPDGASGMLLAAEHGRQRDRAVLGAFAGYATCALDTARALREREAESVRARSELQAHTLREGRLRRLVTLTTDLARAALAGDGLERIVRVMSELRGGAIGVYGRDGSLLAACGELAGSIDELGSSPAQELRLDSAQIRATPIVAEGQHLGWFVQAGAERALEEEAVAVAAVGVAVTLLRELAAEEVEARVRGDMFDALVSSDRLSEVLLRRGQALGHDLARPSQVAVATVDGRSGSELFPLAARWAGGRDGLLLVERAEGLVAVGPAGGPWVHELHELLAGEGPTRVGVGGSTESESYRSSFLGAERAVAALACLGRAGLVRIDGDGIEQLLLSVADPDRFASFVRGLLGPIDEYDARRGSELRRTLELCVENGWNLHATARAAHVHHSTLRYRLARVAALSGLDTRAQSGRLSLQLALLADRLLTLR